MPLEVFILKVPVFVPDTEHMPSVLEGNGLHPAEMVRPMIMLRLARDKRHKNKRKSERTMITPRCEVNKCTYHSLGTEIRCNFNWMAVSSTC